MNTEYIQSIRYKLQKRVRRLQSVGYEIYYSTLTHFEKFLQTNPIYMGIIEDLIQRHPFAEEKAEKIYREHEDIPGEDEVENAAISYFVIKKCLDSDSWNDLLQIAYNYTNESGYDDAIEKFNSVFLDPLYEYIDEQIDDQGAILFLLEKYKHKCEWFRREELYQKWENATKRGEKILALHLYEYLHDQGMNFTIEPWSVSGEVDLISIQRSDEPLIADVKIYNPNKSKGKDYIGKGVNQIYTYTLDYNEPFGYLIIFNTSGTDLKLNLSGQSRSVPFLVHNNKTIFIVTIDIFPHETTASKRGSIKTTEITEKDLIKMIKK